MFSQENNLYNVVLICLYQRCTSELYLCNVGPQPMNNFSQENKLQYCLGLCRPTLHKEITCAILCLSSWPTLHRNISHAQCCPNTSETTWHKKITCAILAGSIQTCFCRKTTYVMLSWSAWVNTAQNNYLHNPDNVGMARRGP